LLTHELIHLRQWHSLDVLLVEVVKAIFWFNPLYSLLGKSIKLNHEYIADAGVLAQYDQQQHYPNLLLQFYQRAKVSHPLVSPSDYSFIKNRFQMMRANTTRKGMMIRLSIFTPLLALVLFSFMAKPQPKPEAPLAQSSQEAVKDRPTNVILPDHRPYGFPLNSVKS